jgi:4-hydroxybenzoyl-CoA reductase subunit beta
MLPLPKFRWEAPSRLDAALELLERGNRGRVSDQGDVAARRGPVLPVAGGTDLVPNLKHRLITPEMLVSLSKLSDEHLRGVRDERDGIRIGALTSLSEAAGDPLLEAYFPALAKGYRLVASPQIRNMGTVGGNLCLDTRCTYYNQTSFWRQALGYCLKREGTQCHVVLGGTRCVAASSSDGATLLMALGAEARLQRDGGDRWLPVEKLFLGEGRRNLAIDASELVTEIRLPRPAPGLRTAYQKLRLREAIDFPALSVAVALELDEEGLCRSLCIVVSSLGAKPRVVAGLERMAAGKELDGKVIDEITKHAYRQCQPLTNIPLDTEWRHEMVPVFVRRGLLEALGRSPGPETA